MSITVVGAGINGLSTAVELQKHLPHAKVKIVADKYSPETTSDIAAGLWRPVYLGNVDAKKVVRWAEATYKHVFSLAKEDAQLYGASIASGYEMSEDIDPEWGAFLSPLEDLIRLETMTPRQIQRYCNDPIFTHGRWFESVLIESSTYLPVLLAQFKANGGVVEKRKVTSIRQECNEANVIVNCCGLGANELLNDKETRPVRGQVFRLDAPWQKSFAMYHFRDGTDRYLLPNQRWLVMGGTHEIDNWDLTWQEDEAQGIYDDCTRLLPSLKHAPILAKRVGLRPYRSNIRLEAERLPSGRTVVHNYGHGGSGLTLFRGCALDAVELTKQTIYNSRTLAKL